jgi:hypothetical protein
MVNWHRKIWVVEPTLSDSRPAADVLFKQGASNEFWLEPAVPASENRLSFTVGYQTGAMESGWEGWVLFPEGSVPFDPEVAPTQDTERLEGTRELDGVERTLQLYVETGTDGSEQLHVVLGFPGGDGDNGLAIVHPR